MISDGVNPLTNPGDIIIVRAGVATGPAALAALAVLIALARTEIVVVADGLAAAALGGLAGWHAGCLARDACLGTPSDLPWALSLEGSDITRHPVEIYAAALFLIGAASPCVVQGLSQTGEPCPCRPRACGLGTDSPGDGADAAVARRRARSLVLGRSSGRGGPCRIRESPLRFPHRGLAASRTHRLNQTSKVSRRVRRSERLLARGHRGRHRNRQPGPQGPSRRRILQPSRQPRSRGKR